MPACKSLVAHACSHSFLSESAPHDSRTLVRVHSHHVHPAVSARPHSSYPSHALSPDALATSPSRPCPPSRATVATPVERRRLLLRLLLGAARLARRQRARLALLLCDGRLRTARTDHAWPVRAAPQGPKPPTTPSSDPSPPAHASPAHLLCLLPVQSRQLGRADQRLRLQAPTGRHASRQLRHRLRRRPRMPSADAPLGSSSANPRGASPSPPPPLHSPPTAAKPPQPPRPLLVTPPR